MKLFRFIPIIIIFLFCLSACKSEPKISEPIATKKNTLPIAASIDSTETILNNTPTITPIEYKKIASKEALDMISDDSIILAVSTQEEFDNTHIKNAIMLSDDDILEEHNNIFADKNQTIFVYSKTAERSAAAALTLIGIGYTNVLDLGTINDWQGELAWAASDGIFYNYFGGELPDDIVTPIDYTVTKKVHRELPEFTFRFEGKTVQPYQLNHSKSRYFLQFSTSEINKLTITDEDGMLIQEITNLNIINKISSGIDELLFEDWNFDGYLDFSLSNSADFSHGYFLWDNINKQYVRSTELEEMGGRFPFSIDYENNQLYVFEGRMDFYTTRFYEYRNGVLTLVKLIEEVHKWTDTEFLIKHYTVSELINAEMVIVDEYIEIPEGNKPSAATWQESYTKLLIDFAKKGETLYFILYDIDKDNIPELIIFGEYMSEEFNEVYTFKNMATIPLKYDKNVFSSDSVLYARGGLKAAPNNEPGLIDYFIGPSAGAFGSNIYYNRIVIDGTNLIIDAFGKRELDLETLHALFDDFGTSTNDQDTLDAAIKEYTHYSINDTAVTAEELYGLFETEEEDLKYLRITEHNISEVIFSYSDSLK